MRQALAAAILLIPTASIIAAEHAKINLDVESGKERKTAYVDQGPPEWGKNPRPVLRVKAGAPIRYQYFFTNVYPNKTIPNVVIHLYVAREEKVGQKELPNLSIDENVVHETAFDMDFKPGAKAGARGVLTINEPGAYLLRVESRETQSDHEHFSAIDLLVEKK